MSFGIFLIIIGVIFLLKNLGFITGGLWDIFWPIVLIVWGLSLITKKSSRLWNKNNNSSL
ncbi:MAG: hypothetical protein HY973_01270 [Candidatus Kerfeldbacteria bacterium]|nr:hypothetical protein [Candidatus Kerfeldbacteria bacterium]